MAEKLHFTDTMIRNLPIPEKRTFYRDKNEKGLIVQITPTGDKSFYLQKSFNGVGQRFFIGKCESISVSEARAKSVELKAQLNKGINPFEIIKEHKREMTVGDLFEEYMDYRINLSERTKEMYHDLWKRIVKPFMGKLRISDVTSDMMKKLHRNYSKKSPYNANRTIVMLKSLYNYAIKEGYFNAINPTCRVILNKEEQRVRCLSTEEMKRFMTNLKEIKDASIRDAIITLTFTGARRGNVFTMRWEDLDLTTAIWTMPKTKTDKNVTIPLVPEIVALLEDRKSMNITKSPWVFWSPINPQDHIRSLKNSWSKLLKLSGIKDFRVHDLRHNWATHLIINGADAFTVQRALTHKSMISTRRYVNLGVEHIRGNLNKTASNMFQLGFE